MWKVLLATCVLIFGKAHGQTLYQKIQDTPELSRALHWINMDDALVASLNSTEEMTILLPDDMAEDVFNQSYPNVTTSTTFFINATVSGNYTIEEMAAMKTVEISSTAQTKAKLWFFQQSDDYFVNNAKVKDANMMASNGYLHILDRVLYPASEASTLAELIHAKDKFSGMKDLIAKASAFEWQEGQNYTVFAPNNEDVTEDIQAMNGTELLPILQRHVAKVPLFTRWLQMYTDPLATLHTDDKINVKYMENELFVGVNDRWAIVIDAMSNTPAQNGVIHVINAVIGVTSGVTIYQQLSLSDMWAETKDKIIGVDAIKNELMKTNMNFTLFVPSKAAWDKVKDDEIKDAEMALKRHVVTMSVTYAQLMNENNLTTYGGDKLGVRKDGDKIMLAYSKGDSKVEAMVTDDGTMTTNGYIYKIDSVLYLKSGAWRNGISFTTAVISLVSAFVLTMGQ